MTRITDYTSYADAQSHASSAKMWDLFQGDENSFNIANECITRHADGSGRPAVRIAHADGQDEILSFDAISAGAARFAHWLDKQGVVKGDRIAFMLEPSLAFYTCLFGAMQTGAISVPMFTLFGPDALKLRIDDCKPKILITNAEKAPMALALGGDLRVVVANEDLLSEISQFPAEYQPKSKASDLAVFQYTSGTTRELPEAVKHTHKALVTLMFAALYGTGVRPGDEFFCPSSPAWGHGLWHGTLAPLGLGITTGTFAGRFDPKRLLKALSDYKITNMSAAATHYRMMKNADQQDGQRYYFKKLSYTGEPIDTATLEWIDGKFKVPVCSMYGTTEIGVVLVNYPGATDFHVKPGSLGKAIPGQKVEVQRPDGTPSPAGEIGELMLWRRGQWETTKDRAKIDEDGYFYHCGRADDVIISAGWTMSAVEIENSLLKHANILECAVIGVPDPARGQVVKAFVIANVEGSDALTKELQNFCRERLAQHEFPRIIAYVSELPKTPAGKVNRKILRDQEAAKAAAAEVATV
jgi:acetyl-CoA synthetase